MSTQDLKPFASAREVSAAAAVFGGFAILYAALRSHDIFGTDGAHRCLEVFHRQAIFFHENNHMLYPVNVLAWSRLAGLFGVRPESPFAFYGLTELMNCFAAAASLALVFLLIQRTIRSWRIALGATVFLGLSRAFFAQATNANEAVMGLFWSLLAIFVLALGMRARSLILTFVSGLLFALSMATYESMVFLAPAGLVLIWLSGAEETRKSRGLRPLLVTEGIFLLGCLIAWLGIHGWADARTGNTRPGEMVRQLFRMQDARSYLGVGPGKLLNLPAGLIRNLFPVLTQFDGLRHVWTGPRSSLAVFLLISAVVFGFLFLCGARLWKRQGELPGPMRQGVWTAIVGLLFTLVPLVIWDPQYEKLWLQPLVLLAVLAAIALKTSAKQGWKSNLAFRILPALLLAGGFFNFPSIASNHRADVSAYFQDAQEVSRMVDGQDLVVGDWDKVATLYGEAWAPEDRIMDFVTQGVYYGRGATGRLRQSVAETERRGGRVYFLGLLDQSETEWNSFLGPRCGVPRSDLDLYRNHSHIVASYRNGSDTIFLRRLDSSPGN